MRALRSLLPVAPSQLRHLMPDGHCHLAALSTPPPRGQQEVREYTLKPEGVRDYLRLTAEHADLRKQLLPFLGCAAKGKE